MEPSRSPVVASPQPTSATPTGQWVGYSSLPEGVWGNGVVQLHDGTVVIFSASRGDSHSGSLDTWRLDPQTGNIVGGPSMTASQAIPTVTQLASGSVMIAGGWDDKGPISSAEILDGATALYSAIAPMQVPRAHAVAVDIGNGRVLVAGGWIAENADGYTATASAEVFDQNTGAWSQAASMSVPRALATATRLQDGRVLVAGGDSAWSVADSRGASQSVLSSAEIYDPASNTWQDAGNMSAPRAAQSAIQLANGDVLVAGGWGDGRELGTASTDVYVSGQGWHAGPSMPGAHAQGRMVMLTDGRLLELGGVDATGKATGEVDLYDTGSATWQQTGSLPEPLYWSAVAVLSDGRVLLVGGSTDAGVVSGQIEVFNPPAR